MGQGCLPPAKSNYSTQEKSFHQNAGSAHLDGPQLGRPLSWEIRLPVGASAGAPPTRPALTTFASTGLTLSWQHLHFFARGLSLAAGFCSACSRGSQNTGS